MAGIASVGVDRAVRCDEYQDVGRDPLAVIREDGACRGLIRRGGGRFQREVARQQASGGEELLAARLELTHEQGAGEAKLFVDRATRVRTHGGRDDQEARRQDHGEQPDEDDDELAAEAAETAHLGETHRCNATAATPRDQARVPFGRANHRARGHGRLLRVGRGPPQPGAARQARRRRRRPQGRPRARRRRSRELCRPTLRHPRGDADLARLEAVRSRAEPGRGAGGVRARQPPPLRRDVPAHHGDPRRCR